MPPDRIFLARALSFSLLLALQAGQAAPAEDTSLLECGIEHSEFVNPLDKIEIGARFDDEAFARDIAPKGNWWRIPGWLAGRWRKSGHVRVLSVTDLNTKEKVPAKRSHEIAYQDDELIGHQKDSSGQIWTYVPTPCVMRSMVSGRTNVNVINSFDFIKSDKDSATVRIFAVTVVVDDASARVVSISQRESIQTWTLVSEDRLSIFDSTRIFNRDGEPCFARAMQIYSRKKAGFRPVEFISKSNHRPTVSSQNVAPSSQISLRVSLRDYLNTHNLMTLVPGR